MPNVSSFGAQTDNATVQGTVTDRAMVIPDIPPQGLMSVGPRVTPHFVKPSLWSALTTYHFFDAVHDAAGASYVAIKPEVPAGTELTDEGYWFLWADPNSQFADLSELVKTYNGRISQNSLNINSIKNNLNDLHLLDVTSGEEISSKLQNAIDNHAGVILPSGAYTLAHGLTVTDSFKYINLGGSTITCDSNFISFRGESGSYSDRVTNVHIENGNVRNKDSQNRTNYTGLSFENYGLCFVNDVEIKFFGNGIVLNGGSEAFIHDTNIQGNGAGISIDAKDLDASAIYISNNVIANNNTSVHIVKGRGVYVDKCVFASEFNKSVLIENSELIVVSKSEFETKRADAIYATTSTGISVEDCLFADTSGTRSYVPISLLTGKNQSYGRLSVKDCLFSDYENCIHVKNPRSITNLSQIDSYVYNHISFDEFNASEIKYMTLCNPNNAKVKDGSMFFCIFSSIPTTKKTDNVITHFFNPTGYCEVNADLIFVASDSKPANDAHYVGTADIDGVNLKIYSVDSNKFASIPTANIYAIYIFNKTYKKLTVNTSLSTSVNVAPVNDVYYNNTTKSLGYFVNTDTYTFKPLA